MPQVLQTLGQRTLPAQTTIDAARHWILSCGWGLTGAETPAEKATLDHAFAETAVFLASMRGFPATVPGGPRAPIAPYWLVFVGVSGTGKTMLARSVVEFLKLHMDRMYRETVAPTLGDGDMRRSMFFAQKGALFAPWRDLCPVDTAARERLTNAQEDWFKVIDELKAQTGDRTLIPRGDAKVEGVVPKVFELNAAGDLLDARLRKWTIVTTNHRLSELSRFWDVRIASRLKRDGAVLCDLSDCRDFAIRREAALNL